MKVYQELDTQIKAALGAIPTLKTKEEYNDQYRNTESDDAKQYPAAYFELIEPMKWNTAGEGWRHATVQCRIHVVAFDIKRDKGSIHTLGQQVLEKMNGTTLMSTGNIYHLTSEWNNIDSSVPKRYKQLKVIILDFEFEAFDPSCMPNFTQQPVTFTIV